MGGLDQVTSGMDSLMPVFQIVAAVIPLLIAARFLVPIVGELSETRNAQRAKESANRLKAEAIQSAHAMIATQRRDFADWLDDALLSLQIECAANPQEQKRRELLDALKATKENNDAQLDTLHRNRSGEVPSAAQVGDVRREWDRLRESLNSLPSNT